MAFTHLLSPMKVGNKVYKNRIVSAPMAFALVATLSTAAFAAAADDADIKKDIGVNAKYVEDIKTSKTISADVVWGEMEFTYSVNGTKTWNAKTHEYDIDTKCVCKGQ